MPNVTTAAAARDELIAEAMRLAEQLPAGGDEPISAADVERVREYAKLADAIHDRLRVFASGWTSAAVAAVLSEMPPLEVGEHPLWVHMLQMLRLRLEWDETGPAERVAKAADWAAGESASGIPKQLNRFTVDELEAAEALLPLRVGAMKRYGFQGTVAGAVEVLRRHARRECGWCWPAG